MDRMNRENREENPFALFSDYPEFEQATAEIKNLIDSFIRDLEALQTKYCRVGACDTASSDEIALYIAVDKLKIYRLPGDAPERAFGKPLVKHKRKPRRKPAAKKGN